MIWLVTAMRCEGEKITSVFGDDMTHIVTGIGPENASFTINKLIDSGEAGPCDKLVNIGVCGAGEDVPARSIHFIDKITDMVSGKEYYPDLSLFPSGIEEGHICTSDDVVTNTMPGELYDEEASAIFEAGQKFFSPDSMLFIKIVSDHGTDIPSKSEIADMVFEHKDTIRSAIARLMERAGQQESVFIPDLKDTLCLTEAMNHDMNNLLRYAAASGKTELILKYIEEQKAKGLLPAKNKREGAVHAGRVKDILIG